MRLRLVFTTLKCLTVLLNEQAVFQNTLPGITRPEQIQAGRVTIQGFEKPEFLSSA